VVKNSLSDVGRVSGPSGKIIISVAEVKAVIVTIKSNHVAGFSRIVSEMLKVSEAG